MPQEEFERLRKVYLPYKEKIKYFVCGHVHSCFEDEVDQIPFVCTGGGGAVIEDVSENIKASDVEHHGLSDLPGETAGCATGLRTLGMRHTRGNERTRSQGNSLRPQSKGSCMRFSDIRPLQSGRRREDTKRSPICFLRWQSRSIGMPRAFMPF